MTTTTKAESAVTHPSLQHPPSDYIDGKLIPIEGDAIVSTNPADPNATIWSGSPQASHVEQAVRAANAAFDDWSAASMDDRIDVLRRWQEVTKKHAPKLAELITDEMGKVIGESTFEANALAGKVDITLADYSMNRVQEYEVDVNDTRSGFCKYKPHGVMAIIGPFNFPAHLANGHFVPAMLMGNTIVLKPSEKTPAVGQMLAEMMHDAGAPNGVFNVVQGAGDLAAKLVNHDDIHGVLFTGSWPVGRKILEANLDRPGRIVALEMGGNNPAVVMNDANLKQAVVECVRAGFATTGQRCTCTRRIILEEGIAEQFIALFCKMASTLIVGPGRSEMPTFMGPLVSQQAVDQVLEFQDRLVKQGGNILLRATQMDRPGNFVTPGVVEVDRFSLDRDCETFGPLVQITTVKSLDEAIEQANATQYGLAASIFTTNDKSYEKFFRLCNAGCINRNTGTAGASSKLPFGGLGHSGNHRPAGSFSSEYCAYPVANMVERSNDAAVPTGLHWEDDWLT